VIVKKTNIKNVGTIEIFEYKWSLISLFAVLVSGFMGLAFILLRSGLETPMALILNATIIVAATAFTPLLVSRLGIFSAPGTHIPFSLISSFLVIATVPMALMIGRWLLPLYFLLAIAGVTKGLLLIKHSISVGNALKFIAVAGVVAAYLLWFITTIGYVNVFTPEQGLLGQLNHDTRFHSAITYLIQNYHSPSLGVDGLVPLKYHFGSHIWFAAFGLLCGVAPIWSYTVGVLIFLVPLLLLALLLSGLSLDEGRKSFRNYLTLGIILILVSDCIGWTSYYISESYTFGLVGLLLSLPLLATAANTKSSSLLSTVSFTICIALIFILMSLKISVGLLWGAAIGWVALRRYAVSWSTLLVLIGCVAVILLGKATFSPALGDYVNTRDDVIVPFYLLRLYPKIETLSSFVFPLTLFLLTYPTNQRHLSKILTNNHRDLIVEATLMVTIIGAGFAFLGIPQDSAVWYFFNVGQWMAMPILIGRISASQFMDLGRHISSIPIVTPIIIVIIFTSKVPNFGFQSIQSMVINLVRAADQQGSGFLQGRSVTEYFKSSLLNEHRLFGREFINALSNSIGQRLINEAQRTNPHSRRDFAIFIPAKNREFWNFQKDCRDKHNIQVSLTGMPSLFGAPPILYDCPRDAYLMNYGPDIFSRDLNDNDICARATERDVKDVLVLDALLPELKSRTLQCSR
jgi:hypothetical protein